MFAHKIHFVLSKTFNSVVHVFTVSFLVLLWHSSDLPLAIPIPKHFELATYSWMSF